MPTQFGLARFGLCGHLEVTKVRGGNVTNRHTNAQS